VSIQDGSPDSGPAQAPGWQQVHGTLAGVLTDLTRLAAQIPSPAQAEQAARMLDTLSAELAGAAEMLRSAPRHASTPTDGLGR
jgi:hypothetical protein